MSRRDDAEFRWRSSGPRMRGRWARWSLAIAVAALFLTGATGPKAENFLAGSQLRIVVPFAPGGAVDQIARIVGARLPDTAVVIDNRDGAGGDIGVSAVERAPPDGKTILLHTSSFIINAAFRRGEAQDILDRFNALARIGNVKFVLVVRNNIPAKTLVELIAFGKTGAKLSYGSTGYGTTLQVAAEMLNRAGSACLNSFPRKMSGALPSFVCSGLPRVCRDVGRA